VKHGSGIRCEIHTFIYFEYDGSPEALPVIIRDERDRSLKLDTLRLGHDRPRDVSQGYGYRHPLNGRRRTGPDVQARQLETSA
jgi:hypothetical protein